MSSLVLSVVNVDEEKCGQKVESGMFLDIPLELRRQVTEKKVMYISEVTRSDDPVVPHLDAARRLLGLNQEDQMLVFRVATIEDHINRSYVALTGKEVSFQGHSCSISCPPKTKEVWQSWSPSFSIRLDNGFAKKHLSGKWPEAYVVIKEPKYIWAVPSDDLAPIYEGNPRALILCFKPSA